MLIASFTLWYVWQTCLPRFATPLRGHGYLVHNYQILTKVVGRGLQPLRRHGHYSLTLLGEMEEHTDGDARVKHLEVELPRPMLVVSYSPPTLPPLKARGLDLCWSVMIATSL